MSYGVLLMPKRATSVRDHGKNGALTATISMRLSPGDKQLLKSVAATVPVIPPLTLARVAMRIGLEVIRQDPSRALGGPSLPRGGKGDVQ